MWPRRYWSCLGYGIQVSRYDGHWTWTQVTAPCLRLNILGFDVFTTLLAHESRDHLTSAGIHAFTADVTKDEDMALLKETVSTTTAEKLDVLVNCA